MFLMNKGYETVIVNKPGYKECSSRSIEIQRVECNDSATIIHNLAMGVPNNWIRFNSTTHLITKDGSTFKLMRAEGIEPEKSFTFRKMGRQPLPLFSSSGRFQDRWHNICNQKQLIHKGLGLCCTGGRYI